REVKRAERYPRPFSLLMIDLDNFKEVNDRFGHAGGDCVLQRFAHIIRSEKRSRDFFGRLGGEEFLLILDGADAAEALQIAERLRTSVSAQPIALQNEQAVALTVSIGLTQAGPDDSSASDVLLRADRALYRAKQQGRNRVCCG
ncbi:MAG: GGDEF domain-containing protein, partial [Thiomonas sp.]